MTDKRPATGIRRKVTFTAWCHHCVFGWSGPEREYKGDAAFDLAMHNTDMHGGTPRGEA